MSITYWGRGSAGVWVGVVVAVSTGAAASVAAAVGEAGDVPVEITGGLVGTGEEQEVVRRKMIRKKRTREKRCCCMKGILTDMRLAAGLINEMASPARLQEDDFRKTNR
jgi:hypothetical protein